MCRSHNFDKYYSTFTTKLLFGAATSFTMERETHAGKMRQCPLFRKLPHESSSLLSSARASMRRSLLCFVTAKDKPLQHCSYPVASTCVSSSNSSDVYVPFPVVPPAAARAVKINGTCEATGAAKAVMAVASALHTAARLNAASSQPTHSTELMRCASLASLWGAAITSRRNSRGNKLANPTAGVRSAEAGCSKSVAWLCGTEWRIIRGISPVRLRMAATAAWTATVATAAAVTAPTRAASTRAYKAAALLLPPLLLSTCCGQTYAAAAAAPPLMRSQSAFVPAITIAALSLTSSPPPSDLKQSGSFAACVQPQSAGQRDSSCRDVRNLGSRSQSCRHGGLLHMLRRRSTYTFFPLDSLASFSSWTAAAVDSESCFSRRNEDNGTVTAGPNSRQSSPHSSNKECSAAGVLPGGTEDEGFLSPWSPLKTRTSPDWSTRARSSAGCTAAFGYSTCCSLAKEPASSRATAVGHLFALATSASAEGAGDIAKGDKEVGPTTTVDRFYAHLRQPQHPAFDLIWQEPVAEMQLHVAYYVHRRTGVRVFSIAAAPQEKEKVFSISFRTPVSDSTGVPHIIEHAFASGSKKFPVKDPFAELLKGSLYSHLNAYTYAEHTTYPVASVNTKDFYNLANVYLDSVLQPRLAYDIDVFRQEGWRIEASLPVNDLESLEGAAHMAAAKQEGPEEAKKMEAKEGEQEGETKVVASSGRGRAAGKAAGEDSAAEEELPLTKRVKLSYQGVVLNEMKGVYSQPNWLLYTLRMKTIFPNISAYAHDSGGNPEVIPSLTYENFKSFYNRFYSLARARIFFYGSDDIWKRLEFIDKNISELDNIPPRDDLADRTSRINEQPAFKEPVRVRQPYPATTAEMEDYVTITWVLDPATSTETEAAATAGAVVPSQSSDKGSLPSKPLSPTDRLALTVLNHLLMGTSAAPLHKALAGSQLGKEVIGGGLADYKHLIFSAGLMGIPQGQGSVSDASAGAAEVTTGHVVNQNAVDRVENIVLETLEKCARDGFKPDAIEAAMNTVEFHLRELNTGTYPKGLAIILQILSDWMVDRDPLLSLKFEKPLQNLKKRLAEGEPVFQQLIKKLFLNNPHRATVHLVADAGLEKELQQKDEARIERLRESLTDAEVKQLVIDTQKLKAKQLTPDSPEALATIPTLDLADIEEEEEIPTEAYNLAGGAVQVLLHRLPTAGILYADVLLPLHKLTLEELQFLTLFARMLTRAGTSRMNEEALANYIGMHTGGVHATVDIRTIAKRPLHVPDPYDTIGFFVVSGKALKIKVPELLDILSFILRDADFSNSTKGVEILKEIEASTVESFINSGTLASLRIGARITATGYIAEQRGGIPYAVFIRRQLEQAKQDWKPIQEKLEGIREKLLTAAQQPHADGAITERVMAFVNLTGDTETLKSATSLDNKGGRNLRQLAKVLTASLPGGVSAAAAASADGKPQTGLLQTTFGRADGVQEIGTERSVKAGSFLEDESDAANLEPLEQIESTQGGSRILAACDWSSVVQKEAQGWPKEPAAAEGFVIPTQVNYVYLGGRMLSPGERFYGHLSVVAEALSKNYVWDQVRVVGGAYGGSFSVDGSGIFMFRSYRDPQLVDTLQRYRKAAAGLEEFTDSLSKRGLTRAIIAVLRDFSQPQSNDQKGYVGFWRHVAGETKQHRAQYRDEVVNTTPQHFREFAARLEKLLQVPTSEAEPETGCANNGQSIVAVVGSDKAFEEAMRGCAHHACEESGSGAPCSHASGGLKFELLDVKKATSATETPGRKIASVSHKKYIEQP